MNSLFNSNSIQNCAVFHQLDKLMIQIWKGHINTGSMFICQKLLYYIHWIWIRKGEAGMKIQFFDVVQIVDCYSMRFRPSNWKGGRRILIQFKKGAIRIVILFISSPRNQMLLKKEDKKYVEMILKKCLKYTINTYSTILVR